MNPNATNSWASTAQWGSLPTGNVQSGNTNQTNYQNASVQASQGQFAQQQVQQNYSPQPSYSTAPIPPQENRRDMIARLYKTILGREPDPNGVSYYLYNSHIREEQIAKDMYESTDHQEILQKAKDVREMILKTEEALKNMDDMSHELESLRTLRDSYERLLQEKSRIIQQLQNIVSPESYNYQGQMNYSSQTTTNNPYLNPQEQYVPFLTQQPVDGYQPNYMPHQDGQTMTYSNQPIMDQMNPRNQEEMDEQKMVEEMILNDPFNEDKRNKGGISGFFKRLFGF